MCVILISVYSFIVLLVIENMLGKKPVAQLTVVNCVIEPVPPHRLTYGHVEPQPQTCQDCTTFHHQWTHQFHHSLSALGKKNLAVS